MHLLELGQNGHALVKPRLEVCRHFSSRHALQTRDLRIHVGLAFGLPGFNESLFFVTAPGSSSHTAERRLSCFFHIRLHHRLITKFITHGLVRFLGIRFATITSFLVEVANGGPTSCPRVMTIPYRFLRQIYISKSNIRIFSKGLDDSIPGRSLFYSSSSAG